MRETFKKGRLIGIDQDEDAIRAATTRLEPFKDRVTIVKDNYSNIKNVLVSLGIDKVDGILWISGSLLTSLIMLNVDLHIKKRMHLLI